MVQKYEANAEGRHVVRLRITANRQNRFVALPIELTESQFNKKGKRESKNWVRAGHPNQDVYNTLIADLWDRALVAIREAGGGASADQVKSGLEFSPDTDVLPARLPGFVEYCTFYIKRRGESATSDTYECAQKAFKKYLQVLRPGDDSPDVPFEQLTISFLKKWRIWALDKYANNTAWLYHSRLKSMYFQAIEDVDGLSSIPTVVTEPFRRVRVPKIKTKKKRLYEDEITRFAKLELPWASPMRRARDICLMMYYAQGMRVGDALRLRQRNYVLIEDGSKVEHRLIYTMHKTQKPKNVLLPAQAVDLLLPYRQACTSPEQPLFPYMRKAVDKGLTPYGLQLKVKAQVVMIRHHLASLMIEADIDKSISAHVFRHSFADLARRSGMDWSKIKDAMSHENFTTTQGYMEELAESAVDEAADLFK